jgi:osmoprotectant transport system substrate-binding protein
MRTPLRLAFATLALLGLVAAACGSDSDSSSNGGSSDTTTASGPAIVVGSQDFGESAILAEIYGQALSGAGFQVRQQALGGFRDLQLAAFESGQINFAPEYVASMLEYLNGPDVSQATSSVDDTLALLQTELEAVGLEALEPAAGVNTNAFVITKETSERLGITSLEDLAAKGAGLRLGGPADCPTNPFCTLGLQEVYGIDLSSGFTALDTGVVPTALGNGEIDVAILFSTDGRIAEEGWVLLTDTKGLLAADNIVPVVTEALMTAYGDTMASVANAVSSKLTTEALIELNRQYDVDKESADDIASAWLSANGLS